MSVGLRARYRIYAGGGGSGGSYIGTVTAATRQGAIEASIRKWGYGRYDAIRQAKKSNPARARAKRAGSLRRKANAAKKMLKVMNPASKPKAVRIRRLKGGGVTITPVKVKVQRT